RTPLRAGSRLPPLLLLLRIQIVDQIDPTLGQRLVRNVIAPLAKRLNDVFRDFGGIQRGASLKGLWIVTRPSSPAHEGGEIRAKKRSGPPQPRIPSCAPSDPLTDYMSSDMTVFCFAERAHAEQFRERFGGEFIAPKDRPAVARRKAIAPCGPATGA